jgi:excisionase family DNA binding protein
MNTNFLTVDELAAKLKVPKSWIYARTRETGLGAMPRIKIGKYLRFEWDQIHQWLRQQNQGDR